MNLILSAMMMSRSLLEKSCHPLEGRGFDLVTHRPFGFERYRCVEDRHSVAKPTAEALDLADDFDVFIPVHTGGHCPHDLTFVEDIDIVVDDNGKLQIRHLNEGLHAGFVRFV